MTGEEKQEEKAPDFSNAYERAKFLSEHKDLWPELIGSAPEV